MTQVRAAVRPNAICAGRPVARTIVVEADHLDDLTDAKLREGLDKP